MDTGGVYSAPPDPERTLRLLGVDSENGLTQSEAEIRLDRNGPNSLPECRDISCSDRVYLYLYYANGNVSQAQTGAFATWILSQVNYSELKHRSLQLGDQYDQK